MNWEDLQTEVLCNSRLSQQESEQITKILKKQDLAGHIWIATSGSTSLKWVALSKQALLTSARSVNRHLQATKHDVWLNPLPLFHVGGLGIEARAHLSGSPVVALTDSWNVHRCYQTLCESKATLTALVPAQVYDFVVNRLASPPALRAVVVGGGHLQNVLYHQARELGWPLLPSYGMTECSSQIATASLDSLHSSDYPKLRILSHVQVQEDIEGYLAIKSPSLLSAYATIQEGRVILADPKKGEWFVTEDRGKVEESYLEIFGRQADFIKIGGESVHLSRLESILESLRLELSVAGDAVLVPFPDSRLGHVIQLATSGLELSVAQQLASRFNQQVLPFERIRQVVEVATIPRSPLKKVLRSELIQLIGQVKA